MTRVAINTLTVLATLTGLAIVWQFRGAALIFCMSLALAAAVRPAIEYFMRRGFPRSLSVAATYLPLLGVIGLLLFLSVNRLGQELNKMADDSAKVYQQINEHWRQGNWFEQEVARALPASDTVEKSQHSGWELDFAKTLFGLTLSVAGMIFDALLIIVMSVYWSLDRVHFERLWLSLLSAGTRTSARQIWRAIETEIGKYLRSEFLQSLLAGLLLAFGFTVIGSPYPVLLALIGAAAWLIPWAGVVFAVLGLIVSSAPSLIIDPTWHSAAALAGGVLYTCLILLLLEIVVEPRLFDRQRYSAVLSAFIAISLALVWGVFGLLVGPPLALVLQVFGGYLYRRRLGLMSETVPSPAEMAARLSALKNSLIAAESPPPEVLSMVDRLATLLEAVRHELGPPGMSPRGIRRENISNRMPVGTTFAP
jgi:predicted PurR-regulated permease PerM